MLNLSVRVKAYAKAKIEGIDSAKTIKEAVKKMVDLEIGSIVITANGKPVGIVTERDVLDRVLSAGKNPNRPVREIMSAPLITIDGLATLGEAAELMVKKKIRRLLVSEGDNIVGIVTQRDIQRALMETFNTLLLT